MLASAAIALLALCELALAVEGTAEDLTEAGQGLLPGAERLEVIGISLETETGEKLFGVTVTIRDVNGDLFEDEDGQEIDPFTTLGLYADSDADDGVNGVYDETDFPPIASLTSDDISPDVPLPLTIDVGTAIPADNDDDNAGSDYFLVLTATDAVVFQRQFAVQLNSVTIDGAETVPVGDDGAINDDAETEDPFETSTITVDGYVIDITMLPVWGPNTTPEFPGYDDSAEEADRYAYVPPSEFERPRPDLASGQRRFAVDNFEIPVLLPLEVPYPVLGVSLATGTDDNPQFLSQLTFRFLNLGEDTDFDAEEGLDGFEGDPLEHGLLVLADTNENGMLDYPLGAVDTILELDGAPTFDVAGGQTDVTLTFAQSDDPGTDPTRVPVVADSDSLGVLPDFFVLIRADTGFVGRKQGDGTAITFGADFTVSVSQVALTGFTPPPPSGVTKKIDAVFDVHDLVLEYHREDSELATSQRIDATSEPIPVIGINVVDSGNADGMDLSLGIDEVQILISGEGFDKDDLLDIVPDSGVSGVGLYLDTKDGAPFRSVGVFDLATDTPVALGRVKTKQTEAGLLVTLVPLGLLEAPDDDVPAQYPTSGDPEDEPQTGPVADTNGDGLIDAADAQIHHGGDDIFVVLRTSEGLGYGNRISVTVAHIGFVPEDVAGDDPYAPYHPDEGLPLPQAGHDSLTANVATTLVDLTREGQQIVPGSGPVAVIGIDATTNKAEEKVWLEQLIVEFFQAGADSDFSVNEDLRPLRRKGSTSGLALYDDNDDDDGNTNGQFDPEIDLPLTLTQVPDLVGELGEPRFQVRMILEGRKKWRVPSSNRNKNAGADLFLVIDPSEQMQYGDDFQVGLVGWGPGLENAAAPSELADSDDANLLVWGSRAIGFLDSDGVRTRSTERLLTNVITAGALTIESVSPSSGPITQETAVQITGRGLEDVVGALFGGEPATEVLVVDAEHVTGRTPTGAETGPVDVTLTTGDGYDAVLADGFTYLPVVESVTPDRGPTEGDTSVTIAGVGFKDKPEVTFGEETVPEWEVEFVSSEELTVVTPAGEEPGAVTVSITNPDETSASKDAAFTYAGIAVTAVQPSSGPLNETRPVEIHGDGLADVESVEFGGEPATEVVVEGETLITCVTPVAPQTGPVDVVVTMTYGLPLTLEDGYTYLPVLTSIDPTKGPMSGRTTTTIIGEGFADAPTVLFGATPAVSVTFVSAEELTAVSPAAGEPGIVEVTVANPDGTAPEEPLQFEYLSVIADEISPPRACTAGGRTVWVTGSGFQEGATVYFCDVEAVTQRLSSTRLEVTVPANPAGACDVRVENPDGSSDTLAGGFQYLEFVAETIEPTEGPLSGGTQVTIRGCGFSPDELELVTICDESLLAVQVVSDTVIEGITPPGALPDSPCDILVRKTTGAQIVLAEAFTYVADTGVGVFGQATELTVAEQGILPGSAATEVMGLNLESLGTGPAKSLVAVAVKIVDPDEEGSGLSQGDIARLSVYADGSFSGTSGVFDTQDPLLKTIENPAIEVLLRLTDFPASFDDDGDGLTDEDDINDDDDDDDGRIDEDPPGVGLPLDDAEELEGDDFFLVLEMSTEAALGAQLHVELYLIETDEGRVVTVGSDGNIAAGETDGPFRTDTVTVDGLDIDLTFLARRSADVGHRLPGYDDSEEEVSTEQYRHDHRPAAELDRPRPDLAEDESIRAFRAFQQLALLPLEVPTPVLGLSLASGTSGNPEFLGALSLRLTNLGGDTDFDPRTGLDGFDQDGLEQGLLVVADTNDNGVPDAIGAAGGDTILPLADTPAFAESKAGSFDVRLDVALAEDPDTDPSRLPLAADNDADGVVPDLFVLIRADSGYDEDGGGDRRGILAGADFTLQVTEIETVDAEDNVRAVLDGLRLGATKPIKVALEVHDLAVTYTNADTAESANQRIDAGSPATALLGLNLVDTGNASLGDFTGLAIESITVEVSGAGFGLADLDELSTSPSISGLALFRDRKVNVPFRSIGIFSEDLDTAVGLSAIEAEQSDKGSVLVTLVPSAPLELYDDDLPPLFPVDDSNGDGQVDADDFPDEGTVLDTDGDGDRDSDDAQQHHGGDDLFAVIRTSRSLGYGDEIELSLVDIVFAADLSLAEQAFEPSHPEWGTAPPDDPLTAVTANVPVILTDLTHAGQSVTVSSPETPVIGLNAYTNNGGDVYLEQLVIEFYQEGSDGDFDIEEDLLALGTDGAASGLAVYRDAAETGTPGSFDGDDIALTLDGIELTNDPTQPVMQVRLTLDTDGHRQSIPADDEAEDDRGDDFFVVLRTSDAIDLGDDFRVAIVGWGPGKPDGCAPSDCADLGEPNLLDSGLRAIGFYDSESGQRTRSYQRLVTNALTASGMAIFRVDPKSSKITKEKKVKIHGAGFGLGAVVYFGEQLAEIRSAGRELIVATAPAGDLSAPAGPVDVRVENRDGAVAVLGNGYTYRPVISSVSPARGGLSGGTEVTIAGAGFARTPAVTFGGQDAEEVEYLDTTRVKARTPEGGDPGKVAVVATNPDGLTARKRKGFEYVGLLVSSVVPRSGPKSGGTRVILTGDGFVEGTRVKFGKARVPARDLIVLSSNRIEAITPASEKTGPVTVKVITPEGHKAELKGGFVYGEGKSQ